MKRRLAAACLLALAGALMVSACSASSGGSRSGAPTTGPSATSGSSSTEGATATDTAVQRLGAARAALGTAAGYRTTGTFDFGGQLTKVDLVVGPKGGHGSLTTASGSVAVLDSITGSGALASSKFFITAPAAYWQERGLTSSSAAAVANQPVAAPSSSTVYQLFVLVDQQGLTQLIFTAAGQVSEASSQASSPVDGQAASVVVFGGGSETKMTIQDGGDQYPLRLSAKQAQLQFSNFGQAPPAPAFAVDAAIPLPK